MKIVPLPMLAVVAVAGCRMPLRTAGLSPWLFPASVYCNAGRTSFAQKISDTQNYADGMTNVGEFLVALFGTNVMREVYSDPFHAEPYAFVTFQTLCPAKDVAFFYEQCFIEDDWQPVRDILRTEMTLCGGDWVKVYAKTNRLVRIHVCGPWEEEPQNGLGYLQIWTFTLSFIGLEPHHLLGDHYRAKGHETFDMDYHIGMVKKIEAEQRATQTSAPTVPDDAAPTAGE